MVQTELNDKKEFLDTMQKVFDELDEDDNKHIRLEELVEHMKNPEIGAYFAQLGVDVDQVNKIFNLLDHDKSGSIDRTEFMFGCLRLKGEAKSLDLAVLNCEVRLLRQGIYSLAWPPSAR